MYVDSADDDLDEPVPEENRIGVVPDGPLYLHGDVEIETSDGESPLSDARVALCRCEASGNEPICVTTATTRSGSPARTPAK